MSYGMKCMIVVDYAAKACGEDAEFSLEVPADPYNEDAEIRERIVTVWYCRKHWRQHQEMKRQSVPTVEWYIAEEA
jgi:hypothetical protein